MRRRLFYSMCLYTTSTYLRTMRLMLIVSIADHYICAHSYNILVFYCNIIIITCRIVYLHLSRPPASICVHIYLSQAMCCAFEPWSVVTFSLFRFGKVPTPTLNGLKLLNLDDKINIVDQAYLHGLPLFSYHTIT